MARQSWLYGLAALLLAGCGSGTATGPPAPPPAPPLRAVAPPRSPGSAAARSLRLTGVPAALRPALEAAWTDLRQSPPRWTGAVAAPATVIYTGQDTTSGRVLLAAWSLAQHAGGLPPGGTLQAVVQWGQDDQRGFPAVGPPRGTPNLTGSGPNLVWVTGSAPWPGGVRGFRALLAHLTTGWVVVSWTWR
jgi:hypothetical protein